MSKTRLFIGTSNVVVPGPKISFPAEFQSSSRLGYYSTLFNSVELNSTFYKVPLRKTFERWTAETHTDFRFSIKLTREVTHVKQLRYDPLLIDEFLHASNGLGKKKGGLLVQFPASIKEDYLEAVEDILRRIQRINVKPRWTVFVEFRHDSWYKDQVYAMLRKQKSTLVLHDKKDSQMPMMNSRRPEVYLRFHGPRGDYRGTYEQEVLMGYAEVIREWIAQKKLVYIYFNNTMGTAFADAQSLRAMCLNTV